jgi:L-rhamnose isomerase
MTKQEIIDELNRVSSENKGENYRTIWEIFCYQNDVDESSEGLEAITFDEWCIKSKNK